MAEYVEHKRLYGVEFVSGAAVLHSFVRKSGNIELEEIRYRHVQKFLEASKAASATHRLMHSRLEHFFDYLHARALMARMQTPPIRPHERQRFTPYVYSRSEVKRLLSAARNMSSGFAIAPRTFSALLLLLYATGITVSEAFRLKREDVNLGKGTLEIHSGRFPRERSLPLGEDLVAALRKYEGWRKEFGAASEFYFSRKNGTRLTVSGKVNGIFRQLRERVGVARHDGATYQPRMQDFRPTFAVHRITSWLQRGADLNRMLPALGVYMGHVGLAYSEKYLDLTSERFRKELKLLSPLTGRRRWKNDSDLIRYLTTL